MLTRKSFNTLAHEISLISNTEERHRLEEIVGQLCADSNPHFDWGRWHKACNGGE